MPKAQAERECDAAGCAREARFSYSLRFWPIDTPHQFRCRCCALTLAIDICACELHWPLLTPADCLTEATLASIERSRKEQLMQPPDFDHVEPEWLSIDDRPANYAALPDMVMHAPAQMIPR